MNEIGGLPLRTPEGNYVTLSQLADINERSGRYVILHQGARRVQTITCNVQGRDVSSFVGEAKKLYIRTASSPRRVCGILRTAEAQTQSRRDLLFNSLLAGLVNLLALPTLTLRYGRFEGSPGVPEGERL